MGKVAPITLLNSPFDGIALSLHERPESKVNAMPARF
jgi:hypothetical protein